MPALIEAIAQRLSQPAATDCKADCTEPLASARDEATDDRAKFEAEKSELERFEPEKSEAADNAAEAVREYAILREVIFDLLMPVLLQNEPVSVLQAIRQINSALDQAIAVEMQRYSAERLRQISWLYNELLASNQTLDGLVRSEQRHLSHLAHELKSPLSSIIGYSSLLLHQYARDAAVHPVYVERSLAGGRRLLKIIDEEMDLSLYQGGSAVPELVEVAQLVAKAVNVLNIVAQQQLSLSVTCEPVDNVLTDKARLRQVVTLLIGNAIHRTASGKVDIHVRSVADSAVGLGVEIAVSNTGPAIAESDCMVEPCYRSYAQASDREMADQEAANREMASSTGFVIAQQMIERLKGNLVLKSERGVGATFSLTLPFCPHN